MHATAVSQQRILTATSLLPTPPAASSIVPACMQADQNNNSI